MTRRFADWMDPHQQADLHAQALIAAANEVHRLLGPGYEEPIYEEALCDEMTLRGMPYIRHPKLAVEYKGRRVGLHDLDLMIGDEVLVDLMACEDIGPLRTVQMISYLRASRRVLGVLLNFNVPEMLFGIKQVRPD